MMCYDSDLRMCTLLGGADVLLSARGAIMLPRQGVWPARATGTRDVDAFLEHVTAK
jgi:hypothetical protein